MFDFEKENGLNLKLIQCKLGHFSVKALQCALMFKDRINNELL